MQREQQRFVNERPKSKALFERAGKSLLGGVPMNWMIKWAGAFPPFVREAQGAHFYDVDGHRYIDFCLGDTGAMTGHSPFATVKAVEEQMKRGITLMLPTEDAIFVARRIAATLRPALLAVCSDRDRCQPFCHTAGSPDHEAFQDSGFQLVLSRHGGRNFHHLERWRGTSSPRQHRSACRSRGHNQGGRVQRPRGAGAGTGSGRRGLRVGRAGDDQRGDCSSRTGLPSGVAGADRKIGTLLIIDETHTICAGPGGYTRAENLDPDFFIFGKAIAGGVPGAAYGFTEEVARSITKDQNLEDCDTGGIGGTLAATRFRSPPCGQR